jgi:hypothetical protein
MLARHFGVNSLLDVSNIFTLNVIFVDERIHVAKLQLDRRSDAVITNDFRKVVNNPFAPIQTTPVIVCHFEDEKVFKEISINGHGLETP